VHGLKSLSAVAIFTGDTANADENYDFIHISFFTMMNSFEI
jgi:hypothetical protein